jgi:hypothetical protein
MTAAPAPDLVEIRRAVDIFFEQGRIFELRALGTTKATISGYFDDLSALANAAYVCSAAVYNNGRGPVAGYLAEGVYLTLNPVRRDLFARSANSLTIYAKHTTADSEVAQRRWLLIDCDPKHPSGISSTDAEHELALNKAREVRDYLGGKGWAAPIFADSGNGGHLLYRIDEPNDPAANELIKRVLEGLAAKFSDDAISIDRKNFNAARICQLYGTVARKGSHVPDRPHRLARIINQP